MFQKNIKLLKLHNHLKIQFLKIGVEMMKYKISFNFFFKGVIGQMI